MMRLLAHLLRRAGVRLHEPADVFILDPAAVARARIDAERIASALVFGGSRRFPMRGPEMPS